jgi:hypothetical protein
MNVLLMHVDRNFEAKPALGPQTPDLVQDLALDTLVQAMAGDDKFVADIARAALLGAPGNDIATIVHRQQVLGDCIAQPAVVRELYALAVEAIERKRGHWFGIFLRQPSSILHASVELLQMFVEMLVRLRAVAQRHGGSFGSRGFTALFEVLRSELADDYIALVKRHLAELAFRRGVLLAAELGEGNQGDNYRLLRSSQPRSNWFRRLLGGGPREYTFHLHPRDEAGGRILTELRDRGINDVANAVAQSADHVLGFFEVLKAELAFYVGCLNLHERLTALGAPVAIPQPRPAGTRELRCTGLYDVCLALTLERKPVGNDFDADGKSLVLITGANQGGKSTLLRAIGLAQLMMQAGLFVGAESYAGELCTALYTHYRREEDATMTKGKLDEELSRLSGIVDALAPDAALLFNESFAATNEREGSEIAWQVVGALLEAGVRVFFVTHQYEFAHRCFVERARDTLCLRAERRADGARTYKLNEGAPLPTSFGQDLYREVFGEAAT